MILRAIVHEEEETHGRQALNEALEERLGLGIDPVQVFADAARAGPDSRTRRRVRASRVRWRRCGGSRACHAVVHRDIQEREHGRQDRYEGRIRVRSLR